MKQRARLTVSQKAAFLYITFVVLVIIFVSYTYISFQRLSRTNEYLYQNYVTSLRQLDRLKLTIIRSDELLTNWLLTEKDTAAQSYKLLNSLMDKDYYDIKEIMWPIVDYWPKEMQNDYYEILDLTDTLITRQKVLLAQFDDPKAFEDVNLTFSAYAQLAKGGKIKGLETQLIDKINRLSAKVSSETDKFINEVTSRVVVYRRWMVFGTFIFLILLTIGFFAFVRDIISNTRKLIDIAQEISEGKLVNVPVSSGDDEFGHFYNVLAKIVNYLKDASEFASKLAENNFEYAFKPVSKYDTLGNALLRLRDNLVNAQKEAELRRIENQQRQWSSQGIAEFAEVIREHSKDLDDLSQAVISKLVNYTVANIGGIYVVNDDDPENIFIELKAFYAYDRHRFYKREFKPGEGLIGECYLEGKTIYMNDVPKDYFKIVSGLGSDLPRSILIVPLIVNEQVMGVVELSSFEEFEPYQIEFVEKIGESIAAAISTVKINIRTQKLLEETARKSQELEQKEAEARENIAKMERSIEELKRTLNKEKKQLQRVLEERSKLEKELKSYQIECETKIRQRDLEIGNLLLAINNTIGYYVLSYSGDFIDANSLYLSFLKLTKDEVIGTKHQRFISIDFVNTGNYKKIWDDLKTGKVVKTSVQYMIEGKTKYINEVYTPVLGENGSLEKVIVFSYVEA